MPKLWALAMTAAVALSGCVEPTGKVGLLPDHRRDWAWDRAAAYYPSQFSQMYDSNLARVAHDDGRVDTSMSASECQRVLEARPWGRANLNMPQTAQESWCEKGANDAEVSRRLNNMLPNPCQDAGPNGETGHYLDNGWCEFKLYQ